jgi:hypothetical protein
VITSEPKHYTPFRADSGEWSFTTPTGGRLNGFPTRADALRIAANTERDDLQIAETKSGTVAHLLRTHFGITKKKTA